MREKLIQPSWERVLYIRYALQAGFSPDSIAGLTGIDPWFVHQLEDLVQLEGRLRAFGLGESDFVEKETAKVAHSWWKWEEDAERIYAVRSAIAKRIQEKQRKPAP